MSASDSGRIKASTSPDGRHVLGSRRRRLSLAGLAFGAWRAAELRAVAAREVRRRLEAAGRRDVDDGHRGLQQQFARAPQAHLQVVALGNAVQVALEQPLDLAARQAGGRGDLIERQRPLDVLFHQLRDPDEALVADANLGAQRHVLPVTVTAHAIDDELLGDQLRDLRAESRLDRVQPQTERCNTARAGEAVTVDGEELVAQTDARELLAQRREVLPVDGRAVLVQQPRLRQGVAAGAQRAEGDAPLGEAAQRRHDARGNRLLHVDAPADEQDVHRAELLERDRRGELQPVAGRGGLAVEAHNGPLVGGAAGHGVRHAQWLDRVRQRDHRVARQRQEGVLDAGQWHMTDFTPFLPECDLPGPRAAGGPREGGGSYLPFASLDRALKGGIVCRGRSILKTHPEPGRSVTLKTPLFAWTLS